MLSSIVTPTARRCFNKSLIIRGIMLRSRLSTTGNRANKNQDSVPGLHISQGEHSGRVHRIEWARPEKYNAITWDMYEGVINALNTASNDAESSVTVFSGQGDYYCSGNDLSNFAKAMVSPEKMREVADFGEDVLKRFVRAHIDHSKALVALINGPAIGLSVTVLPLFDLVVASDKASFLTPFTMLGQSPEGCSSYTFPTLMGPTKAAEMLLFNRKLSAEEAMERNLVGQVIPHNQWEQETARLVKELAIFPPESLRLNKQLLRDAHRDRLLAVNEAECRLLKSRWLSAECHQALAKFMQRKSGSGSKL